MGKNQNVRSGIRQCIPFLCGGLCKRILVCVNGEKVEESKGDGPKEEAAGQEPVDQVEEGELEGDDGKDDDEI